MNRPPIRTRPSLLLPALVASILLCAAVAASGATAAPIEAIWSFGGGQIGVQRLSDGTYAGTVVAETTFAECPHPVGQSIWSGMTEQKDGSFWGYHQWYTAKCEVNPKLGPTAWRVLEEPSGARYMRVCFSHPDTSQPTISPDGSPKAPSEYTAHGVTYGCYDSALISTLPSPAGPGASTPGGKDVSKQEETPAVETLSLANPKKCLSVKLKVLSIRLKDPKYDPFKTVIIIFKGHKLKTSRHGSYVTATIKLPAGGKAFTVSVKATTVLGHHLSARRTYRRCKSKKRGKR